MAKLMLFCMVALLATTLIMGASVKNDYGSCKRHGDPCVSDSECCANIKCHRYANRCQAQIGDELADAVKKFQERRNNKNN